MSVIKAVIQKDFTILYNAVLGDPNISFKAKGLWAYCMSKPTDWEFHVSHLATICKEKEKAIYAALDELIKARLVVRNQINKGKGERQGREGFGKVEYTIYPYPLEIKEMFAHRPFAHPQVAHPQKDVLQRKDKNKEHIHKKENIKEEGRKSDLPSAEAKALKDKLLSKMKEIKRDFIPKALEKWDNTIDKMIRIDKRDPNVISEVIECLDERALIYVQSADKFRKEFDSLELKNKVTLQKKRISNNRQFFLKCQNQYPKEFKNITFDILEVVDIINNIKIPFDLGYKDFAEAIAKMIGGEIHES